MRFQNFQKFERKGFTGAHVSKTLSEEMMHT
jgi:hypothetical protein